MDQNINEPCSEEDAPTTNYDYLFPEPPVGIRDEIMKYMTISNQEKSDWRFMLDVGCGEGRSTKMFTRDFSEILGIDVSEAQINLAKKDVKESNIKFQVVHDNILPVKANSTDLILSCESLHYLDIEVFFSECSRVLSDGGILASVVSGPNLLKSTDGKILCDFWSNGSKWKKAIRDFCLNAKMDKVVIDTQLDRFQSIFNSMRNPNKWRDKIASLEVVCTVEELIGYFSVVGGSLENTSLAQLKGPLDMFRRDLAENFQAAGMEFNEATKIVMVHEYHALIVKKTKDHVIA